MKGSWVEGSKPAVLLLSRGEMGLDICNPRAVLHNDHDEKRQHSLAPFSQDKTITVLF